MISRRVAKYVAGPGAAFALIAPASNGQFGDGEPIPNFTITNGNTSTPKAAKKSAARIQRQAEAICRTYVRLARKDPSTIFSIGIEAVSHVPRNQVDSEESPPINPTYSRIVRVLGNCGMNNNSSPTEGLENRIQASGNGGVNISTFTSLVVRNIVRTELQTNIYPDKAGNPMTTARTAAAYNAGNLENINPDLAAFTATAAIQAGGARIFIAEKCAEANCGE